MSTTTAVALDPDKLYEIVDGRPEGKGEAWSQTQRYMRTPSYQIGHVPES